MPVGIVGLGTHVPDQVIDNRTISAWTGATPEWVAERTGVLERRYAAAGTPTSDLALPAARAALEGRHDARERLDLLVLATCTPDSPQPATAAVLQHKLGLDGVPSFDVNAVCSGFLYALEVGECLLRARGSDRYALVVAADLFSSIVDRTDRRTVSLFGDGAGAVLLGPVPDGYGLHATALLTDGAGHGVVGVAAGGTRQPATPSALAAGLHHFRMDGRGAKNFVFTALPKVIGQALDQAGLVREDVDRFVFHQANARMLEMLARDLGIDPDRVELTADRYGNTAAASVPLTLAAAHARKPLRRGEKILLAAAGGGLTAGATVLTWY
jgi:3-oxoacyl-(acyl-carrier-protein) synthase III